MKMIHKLDLLMKERHLNKRQLSMQAHIPYTTISSFYDKGTENVKLSTLKTLASFLMYHWTILLMILLPIDTMASL